jgi:DsbC/DsbD-like thiol-disulfide interchange protein
MTRMPPPRATRTPALALAAFALGAPALAFDQSDVLRAELLPGWREPGGRHIAALHLTLAPGWKTYWRSPGDAGIPPAFDWAGSRNVGEVQPMWPAPEVFLTNGLQSVGYHDELILPLAVTPRDPQAPLRLAATIGLGICKDICLPAEITVSADLVAPGAPHAGIRAALDARPATAAEAGVGEVRCAVEPIADGLRLTAHLALPRGAAGGDETVVFEAGAPGIWVAEATAERQGSRLVAVTEMVGATGQPFALDRSALVITVIGGGGAVEIRGCPGG